MKKRNKTIICICLLGLICMSFTACGDDKSKLCGLWIPITDATSDFPEESMELFSDGTGVVDGLSCDWTGEKGRLAFDILWEAYTYDYQFKGKKLILSNDEYEVIYEKQ